MPSSDTSLSSTNNEVTWTGRLARIAGGLILAGIVVGLVILLGYLAWKLISNYWASIVAYGYLAFAIAGAAFSVVTSLITAFGQNSMVGLNFRTALQLQMKSVRNRAVLLASVLATGISDGLVWPTVIFRTIELSAAQRQHRIRVPESMDATLATATVLVRVQLLFWLTSILTVAIALVLTHLDGGSSLRLVVYAVLVAAILRLLSYAIVPEGLASQLRVSTSNPYLQAILVGASGTLLLGLCFTMINQWRTQSPLTLEGVQDTLAAMFSPWRLVSKFRAGTLTVYDAWVGIAGFTLSATAIRTLLSIKSFRRTDLDHINIAHLLQKLGKFRESLAWIKRVSVANANSLTVEAVSLAGVHDLDRATRCMESASAVQQLPADRVRDHLQLAHRCCYAPVPHATIMDLVNMIVRSNRLEFEFSFLTSIMAGTRVITPEILESIIRGNYPQDHEGRFLLARLVVRMASATEGKPDPKLLEFVRRWSPAGKRLRALFSIYSLTTRVMFDNTTDAVEDAEQVHDFLDTELDGLVAFGVGTQDQEFQKGLLIALQFLTPLVTGLAHERVDEFQYKLGKLEAAVGTLGELDEFLISLVDKNVTGHANKLAGRLPREALDALNREVGSRRAARREGSFAPLATRPGLVASIETTSASVPSSGGASGFIEPRPPAAAKAEEPPRP